MSEEIVRFSIVPIVNRPSHRCFAVKDTDIRFELSRMTQRKWRWRVWLVIGSDTVGYGIERNLTLARNEALKVVAGLVEKR